MSRVARLPSEAEGQAWETEDDDTAEGDLGYGLGRRPGGICEVPVSHLFKSRKRSDGKNSSPPLFSRNGDKRNSAVFQYSRQKSFQDTYLEGPRIPYHKQQSSTDSNSELSNVELRQRLHETLEEVEILKTELEASQRQLEGKEEALKILQSMAIFGKATSHTQAVLQKTVEHKRSLEKEINALQWEIQFDQNRFKNIEESWIQKYDRLNCENAVLKETLKLKTEEIKMLKSENASNVKNYHLRDLTVINAGRQGQAQSQEIHMIELAVLGACLCHRPRGSPCACARLAASTRKMLLQLKQEMELLQKSKEEAYIMADAFRIAFEQQLMRKNDQALRLTQTDKMCKKATKWIRSLSQGSKKTLGEKLSGMLPSENSSKSTNDQDDPQEIFKMLIDLLNDKEEALAHQRKVSYMLARALENKDTTSKEIKERNSMKDSFTLKNPWQKILEFPVSCDPVHSGVQIFNSVGCICSIQHFQTDQKYTRTLKRSHSLPSNMY
ncbi:hypothetical protein E5288_WYG012870 [Bos mutus]|uniref:Coiled-coil domain-containing protein 125 n=1 Tax=Bos mutus TaxID=72004 RepID=A0A6B0QWA0_9CETA|nr:hypothetical protein [Bos mutus]